MQLEAVPSRPIAVSWEKRPTPTSLQLPFRELQRAVTSSLSLLFSILNNPFPAAAPSDSGPRPLICPQRFPDSSVSMLPQVQLSSPACRSDSTTPSHLRRSSRPSRLGAGPRAAVVSPRPPAVSLPRVTRRGGAGGRPYPAGKARGPGCSRAPRRQAGSGWRPCNPPWRRRSPPGGI